MSVCEIRICPENPDVKCGEVRAITPGISEFVRMRNPDLSGKSACEMRRNPGNHLGEVKLCPDAKSAKIRICLLIACLLDCADLSKKSGCEMRRNPGNHLRDVNICPDAQSGEIRICLLLLACLLLLSEFVRMRNPEKSGQSPQG